MKSIENIAVLIASYKRLPELQHQIYTMVHQDCAPALILVAVKGFTEYHIDKFIRPKFAQFPNVKIKCVPNKNQLSNLLDCVRDEDLTGIDYFLKIDDDDFYPHDYVSTVRKWVNLAIEINGNFEGHGIQDAYSINRIDGNMVIFEYSHDSCWGGTLGFSPLILEKLFAVENNAIEILPAIIGSRLAIDQLIMRLVSVYGELHTIPLRYDYIYNNYSPSCWRDQKDYLGLTNNIHVSNSYTRQQDEEYFIALKVATLESFRMVGNRIASLHNSKLTGTCRPGKDGSLAINWDSGIIETYSFEGHFSFYERHGDKYSYINTQGTL